MPLGQLSPRDEGLTFTRDKNVYLDQGPYRVESFAADGRVIVVSAVERKGQQYPRRSYNLFRRTYTLRLAERFAREQEQSEGSIVRMHVHASFARHSDRVLTWPIDEPLLSARNVPIGTVQLTQKRSYRSLYLIAFGSPDYEPGEAFSPIVRRTLAASLQDVLGLLFPALAERVAVVDLAGEWGPTAAPPFNRLPLRYPIGRIEAGTIEDSIRLAFQRAGYVGGLAHLVDGWSSAALAVIEDADHDIGVARRIHDSWPLLVPIWKRYLDWAAEGKAPWGASDGWFDAAAAANVPLFSGN